MLTVPSPEPEPHRFSIRLSRPLWIGLAIVVLFVVGVRLRIGLPIYRQPQSSIRISDSLASTIEKLRLHQISVNDATPAVAWEDGKDRRLYQLSRSRTPKDALVLVVLHKADGTDSEIESMYWDIDFIMQYVAKIGRPDPKHEAVQTVDISDLISELVTP